jgi:CSLREA domain-containing protein
MSHRTLVRSATSRARRTTLALAVIAAVVLGGQAVTTAPAQAAETYVVNSSADDNDGACDPAPGDCTLREAVILANADVVPDLDTIEFEISTGPQTIALASDLPIIGEPVSINGTTQPGYTDSPMIELDGGTSGQVGLWLSYGSDGSTILAMTVNDFANSAVLIDSAGNSILGNYLGVDAAGTDAVAGGAWGTLRIRNDGADGNVVGGPTADDANVIGVLGGPAGVKIENFCTTGDVTDNLVQGNKIGIGSDDQPLGNSGHGIAVTSASPSGATGNRFLGNAIDENGASAIELGGDGADRRRLHHHRRNSQQHTGHRVPRRVLLQPRLRLLRSR